MKVIFAIQNQLILRSFQIIIKDHMQKYRRKVIYDLFVRQLLQAGRKCLEFENHKFVPIYVRQARRLADLLREDHFETEAQELRVLIDELEVLQKHPVTRSQSNTEKGKVKRQKKVQKSPPVQKFEIWRPPVNEPTSPNQVISPMTFSPDFAEARKSILKTGGSPAAPRQRKQFPNGSHDLSIKVDIHRSHENGGAINGSSPIFLPKAASTVAMVAAATTLNRTAIDARDKNGSDYKKITAIELIDKGGIYNQNNNQMTRMTTQLLLDGAASGHQDMHVSIL